MNDVVHTPAGEIPRIMTMLTTRDMLGTLRVRLGIRRARYNVPPGLYAAGSPTPDSHVFVTANYKPSFDHLRSRLGGRDAWIMVLDTKGVNVWCSAGKGTFGTAEVINRARAVRLENIVSHRTLILPQLGATGVSGHRVRTLSGWRVVFGPVRAQDLPAFLDAGMKAAAEMRRVRFGFRDRAACIPIEVVQPAKYLLAAAAVFLLLSGIDGGAYTADGIRTAGARSVIMLLAAYLAGTVVVPALLPWIPGRAFSVKGALIGAIAVLGFALKGLHGPGIFDNGMEAGGWLLIGPAVVSFLAMNVTGVSTYTSPSGVRREMRIAVPSQVAAAAAGVTVWIVGRLI